MKSLIDFINQNTTFKNQDLALKATEDLLQIYENEDLLYSSGLLSANLGDFHKSLYYYQRLLNVNSNHKQALFDLGALYSHLGDLDKSIEYAENLIKIDPNYNDIQIHLANAYSNSGNHDKASEFYQSALGNNPYNLNAWSDLFLSLNYTNITIDERIAIRNEFSKLLKPHTSQKINNKNHKIRLAYISSDFRNHAVAYFLKGLITKHDTNIFDIYYYSLSNIEDEITRQFKNSGNFINCSIFSIEELTKVISNDEIDILIDLNGFTQPNKLEALLQNIAPIQITWLGFLNTLGIPTINYKISDIHLIDDEIEDYYTEDIIKLNNSLVYDPPSEFPDISQLPYKYNGYVTFGFFNNPRKLNLNVCDKWIEIFKNYEGCKLLIIKSKYEKYNQNLKSYFNSKGFTNIEFVEETSMYDFMKHIGSVDIALDAFPHSGGATSAHCLWMGVPVLTIEGKLEFERISSALLKTVGLEMFVCTTEDDYVKRGSSLDFSKIEDIRVDLRSRFPDYLKVIKELESELISIYKIHQSSGDSLS